MRTCSFGALTAALVTMTATSALSEGMTLRVEGGIALVDAEDVGIFSIVRRAPDSPTSQFEDYGSIPGGPGSLAYRAEANWAFDLGNGSRLRLGGILSGLDGSYSEVTPVYYLVTARPGDPSDGRPFGEIRVCDTLEPCATFDGQIDRSYHEIMPEVMFGRSGPNGSTSWFGLQGFAGQLKEQTSNRAFRFPPEVSPFDTTTLTELEGDATGLMLAFQHERPLKSGMTLLLGAGIGQYEFDTTGFSVNTSAPANLQPVADTVEGTRAQFSIGLEKAMGNGLSLGAMIRADYWTDQPRIQNDWSSPPCSPTLCEPPRGTGNFNLTSDDVLNVSVGLSLTWRM